MTVPERRAQKLLRWYPRSWRDRYGDEFAALLVDDIADRPRSVFRDLDVVRAGLGARLALCGLTRGQVPNRSVATTVAGAGIVVYLGAAVSIWTQLVNAWLTAPPATPVPTVSLVVLSTWITGSLLIGVVIGALVATAVIRACRSGCARLLVRPLVMLSASTAVLIAGVLLMASRSPGARAGHHDGALAAAARVGWAATDTINTFWLHPSRLLALPVLEISWMVVSPIAVVALLWSLLRVVRSCGVVHSRLPRHALRASAFLAPPCFVGAAGWVLGSQHAANANYRAGTLDVALVAGMAVAAYVVRTAGGAAVTR